jgi:hypothetical protein
MSWPPDGGSGGKDGRTVSPNGLGRKNGPRPEDPRTSVRSLHSPASAKLKPGRFGHGPAGFGRRNGFVRKYRSGLQAWSPTGLSLNLGNLKNYLGNPDGMVLEVLDLVNCHFQLAFSKQNSSKHNSLSQLK